MNSETDIDGYLEDQLLVAMPELQDSNFAGSVTLICQHTGEGAVGITINRKAPLRLGDVFDQLSLACDDEQRRQRPVLKGGPVQEERGFVVHTPHAGFDSSLSLSSEIMVTTSRDVLEAIAEGEGPEEYLVALGYAGWGNGQLEDELRQNAWLSVPVSHQIVFSAPLQDRWRRAIAKLGVNAVNLHAAGGQA